MKFYSFPGSSQFPYAAKISQRIPRIPFKNIAKGYYVKKTNKHQMWKERAPRRYTILWFWSQYFDCVDINLASFAQVLHPLHPHPPPPHPTPSQGFVNTTSANIRMVGGSPPNDSNAQWTSCMAYSQKRLKKKNEKKTKRRRTIYQRRLTGVITLFFTTMSKLWAESNFYLMWLNFVHLIGQYAYWRFMRVFVAFNHLLQLFSNCKSFTGEKCLRMLY